MKVGKDRIDKSPDQRVQEAVALVFAKFSEFRSVRQVLIWLVEEGIKLPVRGRNPEAQGVVWRTPAYNTVHNILTNPIYAGAYVFGRTGSRVSVEAGHKCVRRGLRRARQDWHVLLKDRHEGYISWDEFERNQRVIADNANKMGIGAVGARSGVVSYCLRVFSGAVIADESCMSSTAAITDATNATERGRTMAGRAASRLLAQELTAP